MASLPRFSVRNPVLINLLMILAIALGTYSLLTLPRELFPQVRLNWVVIRVDYPGASPEEVEKLVSKPIEDEIRNLDHLDMFLSDSVEGQARLQVIFESISKSEFERVYQELRQEVDKVELPEGAEKPVYLSLESSTWLPMATVVVAGDLPWDRMRTLAEELEDEIEALRGVDSVSLSGLREREIWVEVDPHQLYKYNLSLDELARRLRAQNLTLPAGNIKVGNFEYLLRSTEEFQTPEEIAQVVIVEDEVGNHVRLGEIARIRDTFAEPLTLSRYNGSPSVSLNVYKSPEGNTLELIEQFRRLAQEKMRSLPPGVEIAVTGDFSERIVDGISKLSSSGLYGGVLVLILLLTFLGWRNALLVCWGIPVTFLLTFHFIDLYGESINESSLFALVLVLGMIVDDAIVVIENIARYLNRGISPREAVIRGAEEVLWPVVSSSLTTVAAFLPLMLLPGIIGEFMKVIPVCVSVALLASLMESLVILPSHVAEFGQADPHRRHNLVNRLVRMAASRYRRLMGRILRRRWAFLCLALLLILSSALVVPFVGVDLFADDPMSLFFVRIWMPEGTSLEVTDQLTRQFEAAALSLPREEVVSVVAQVGRLETESGKRMMSKDVAQIVVDLVEAKDRRRSIDEIMQDLRERTRHLTGYKDLQIAKLNSGPPVGKPLEVKIKGPRIETLRELAERLKAFLREQPGVSSIEDDWQKGKNEVRIRIREGRAHLLGLDATQVARHVKYAFEGIPATVIRDRDDEADVVIKFLPQYRRGLEDLVNLKIPLPQGGLVAFPEVAEFVIERGWSEIHRFDGERAITVSADVDSSLNNAVALNQQLGEYFQRLAPQYPGYRLDFRGEFKEFEQAFDNIGRLFLVGVILIYMILGAQFRSYLQPLLVLSAVPFAFAGAMVYLLANSYALNIAVMYGLVALSGVAVNDSIVLISFINDGRARGASLYRAVLNAGKRRLRPIFLTTATTVFGLLPMALGVGGESVVWMPLAGTIVWGLGIATLLILLVLPPLYVALEDLVTLFGYLPGSRLPSRKVEAVTPVRKVS